MVGDLLLTSSVLTGTLTAVLCMCRKVREVRCRQNRNIDTGFISVRVQVIGCVKSVSTCPQITVLEGQQANSATLPHKQRVEAVCLSLQTFNFPQVLSPPLLYFLHMRSTLRTGHCLGPSEGVGIPGGKTGCGRSQYL